MCLLLKEQKDGRDSIEEPGPRSLIARVQIPARALRDLREMTRSLVHLHFLASKMGMMVAVPPQVAVRVMSKH